MNDNLRELCALAGALDTEHVSLEPVVDWVPTQIMVDSGASENVCPPEAFPGYSIIQTDASLNGMTYQAAGGKEIPNLGATQPVLYMPNGDLNSMTFQVAPVNKILAAVSRITSHQCRVIFDEPHIGSVIENKRTGRIIPLRQINGIYILDVWVRPTATATNGTSQSQQQLTRQAPFGRQGRSEIRNGMNHVYA